MDRYRPRRVRRGTETETELVGGCAHACEQMWVVGCWIDLYLQGQLGHPGANNDTSRGSIFFDPTIPPYHSASSTYLISTSALSNFIPSKSRYIAHHLDAIHDIDLNRHATSRGLRT